MNQRVGADRGEVTLAVVAQVTKAKGPLGRALVRLFRWSLVVSRIRSEAGSSLRRRVRMATVSTLVSGRSTMTRLIPLTVALFVLGSVTPAAPPGKFTPLDLKPYANQKIAEDFSNLQGNHLKTLGKDGRTLAGVNFKIGESVIHLGSRLLEAKLPTKVEGIKVGQPCAKVHILHATQYGNGSTTRDAADPLFIADDTKIAEYKVRYEDGTIETIPVVFGQDVRDWWFSNQTKGVTRGKVAWEGDNEPAKNAESRIRLYLCTWENPHQDKKIASIDYAKTNDGPAAPFCVAISLEAK